MLIEMKNVKLGPLFDAVEIVTGAELEQYEPASTTDYTRIDAVVYVANEFVRGQLVAEYSRQLYIDAREEGAARVPWQPQSTRQGEATQPLD